MKADLFNMMMDGFAEAKKYRRGVQAHVRVAKFARVKPMKPQDIRKVRIRLGLSQFDFATYLGTSVGSVRSWEQGVRHPNTTALRLLTIAKKKPATLLELS